VHLVALCYPDPKVPFSRHAPYRQTLLPMGEKNLNNTKMNQLRIISDVFKYGMVIILIFRLFFVSKLGYMWNLVSYFLLGFFLLGAVVFGLIFFIKNKKINSK
jgi:hypothetical protein